jgi:hypothetical protein
MLGQVLGNQPGNDIRGPSGRIVYKESKGLPFIERLLRKHGLNWHAHAEANHRSQKKPAALTSHFTSSF